MLSFKSHLIALRQHIDMANSFLTRYPYTSCLFIILLIALIAMTRRPDMFFNAQFWAEDGSVWFTGAYRDGLLANLFEPYPEYFAVPQRILSFLSTLVPFSVAPLLLTVIGLAIQLLPVLLFISGRLRYIAKTPLAAIVASIVYIGLPNTVEVFSSFANLQWHLSLTALLLVFSSPSASKAWRIFDTTIIIAAGLAGPNVIFLMPIAAAYWWFNGKTRLQKQNLIIISLLSIVQLLTIFLSENQRTGTPPDTHFIYLVKMISGQIFTGGIVGQNFMNIFYTQELWLYTAFIIGVSICAYAAITGPLWLKLMQAYALILVTATLLTLKNPPGGGYDVWQGLTNPTGGQRYWYLPIFVWLVTITWITFNARSKTYRALCMVLLGTTILFGVPQDWRQPPLKDNDFSEHAARFKALPSGATFTAPINPAGWQIEFTKK